MKKQMKNKSEKGFALVETLAFLFVFITLTAYVIDFFTVIHTGIVNSIAARTYLFETLQHRNYPDTLRQELNGPGNDRSTAQQKRVYFAKDGQRFHGVNDEDQPVDATDKTNAVGRTLTQVNDNDQVKPSIKFPERLDDGSAKASTIVIKSGYGICLDAKCGG
jgi:hypothetical protein